MSFDSNRVPDNEHVPSKPNSQIDTNYKPDSKIDVNYKPEPHIESNHKPAHIESNRKPAHIESTYKPVPHIDSTYKPFFPQIESTYKPAIHIESNYKPSPHIESNYKPDPNIESNHKHGSQMDTKPAPDIVTANYRPSKESSKYQNPPPVTSGWGYKGHHPVEPSRLDNIPGWGPPPKQFRPFGGGTPGWGRVDLFHEPSTKRPHSSEEYGGWYHTTYKPKGWSEYTTQPPYTGKGWGWSSHERTTRRGWDSDEFTTRRPPPVDKDWDWQHTTEKSDWRQWSHSERPYRPGWHQKGPCCQSGKPYFSPSPYFPGYNYNREIHRYTPNRESEEGEDGGGEQYRVKGTGWNKEPTQELEAPPYQKGRPFGDESRRNFYLSPTPFPTDSDGLFHSWRSRGHKKIE